MFTGIITTMGRIETVMPLGDHRAGVRLTIVIDAGTKFDPVACGDSIAVQGACMTVVITDIAAGAGVAPPSVRLAVEVSRARTVRYGKRDVWMNGWFILRRTCWAMPCAVIISFCRAYWRRFTDYCAC